MSLFANPIVQQLLVTTLPPIAAQGLKAAKLKLPKWLWPIASAGLGVAASYIPGLDAVGPGLGALLGGGGCGAYTLARQARVPGFSAKRS